MRWLLLVPVAFGALLRLGRLLVAGSGGLGRRALRTWTGWPAFARNLTVGILIAASIQLGHGISLVRETKDMVMDWMNRLQVDTGWLNSDAGMGYTLLDIDEVSFAAWGEPWHVPRGRLAELIRYAADGGARVIVVDIDLSRHGTDTAADRVLAQLLEDYPADAPDLILLRTTRSGQDAGQALVEWRGTYFDTSNLSEAVHFAQARFAMDRSDQKLRRWHLLEAGCLAAEPIVLPSVQLITDLLLRSGRQGWRQVQQQLADIAPADCAVSVDWHPLIEHRCTTVIARSRLAPVGPVSE